MPKPAAAQRRREREKAVEEFRRQRESGAGGLTIGQLTPEREAALEVAKRRRRASPAGNPQVTPTERRRS
jgi:hypothetical protein